MRQPEISNLDVQGAFPDNHHVARREIAVHDALVIELDHGAADLLTRLRTAAGKAREYCQEETAAER